MNNVTVFVGNETDAISKVFQITDAGEGFLELSTGHTIIKEDNQIERYADIMREEILNGYDKNISVSYTDETTKETGFKSFSYECNSLIKLLRFDTDMIIAEEMGNLEGHYQCQVYKLTDGKYFTVDWDSTNGETMLAWESDELGYPLNPNEESLSVAPVYLHEELIGFNNI